MAEVNALFLKRRRLRGVLSSYYFKDFEEQKEYTLKRTIEEAMQYRSPPIEQTPVVTNEYPTQQEDIIKTSWFGKGGGNKRITMEQYINAGEGKGFKEQMTTEQYQNAAELIDATNELLSVLDIKDNIVVTSGGRTKAHHEEIYRQKGQRAPMGSPHLTAQAMDIYDPEGKIKKQLFNNPKVAAIMKKRGLYIENPNMTSTWVHIQTKKPGRVGNEIWGPEQLMRYK